MGYYINPPDMTKEEFLEKHGKPLSVSEATQFNFDGDNFPVCLVNNVGKGFTAAGIAYDSRERDVFIREDGRPKKWYSVTRDDLKPYLPVHLRAA